jgi:hypothetical protein
LEAILVVADISRQTQRASAGTADTHAMLKQARIVR